MVAFGSVGSVYTYMGGQGWWGGLLHRAGCDSAKLSSDGNFHLHGPQCIGSLQCNWTAAVSSLLAYCVTTENNITEDVISAPLVVLKRGFRTSVASI